MTWQTHGWVINARKGTRHEKAIFRVCVARSYCSYDNDCCYIDCSKFLSKREFKLTANTHNHTTGCKMSGNAFSRFKIRKVALHEIYGEKGLGRIGVQNIPKNAVMPEGFGLLEVVANATGVPVDEYLQNTLGSTGKKEWSGDIDLAIDSSRYDKEKVYASAVEVLGADRVNAHLNLDRIHLAVPVGNEESVQVDLFFGSPKMLQFFFHAPRSSKYSGSYRTALLMSMVANLRFLDCGWVGVKDGKLLASCGPSLSATGLNWSYIRGFSLKDPNKLIKPVNMKNPREFHKAVEQIFNVSYIEMHKNYFISSEPQEIVEYVFGKGTTIDLCDSYETLYNELTANTRFTSHYREKVLEDFAKKVLNGVI